jgi:membrane dipeptidase
LDVRAAALLKQALVFDMTLPLRTPGDPALKAAIPRRLVDAGFDFVSVTVAGDEEDTLAAVRAIGRDREFFRAQPDTVLVDTVDDIFAAKAQGKLAVGFHFQGSVPVGRDLTMVDLFYKLGVRHMLMAYNQKNFVADGCHELGDGGLSRFGRDLVSEMIRVGMMVDVAHTGYRASMDVLEYSDRPVIVSHGNVWALHQHPRCYRDDQLRALARSGGVIGLTGLSIFTGDDAATVDKYVDQIEYVIQLAGPDHVGLGMDYVYDLQALIAFSRGAGNRWPAEGGYGRPDVRQLEPEDIRNVTRALLARGHAEDDVRKFLGGNWLRVMRSVWR